MKHSHVLVLVALFILRESVSCLAVLATGSSVTKAVRTD